MMAPSGSPLASPLRADTPLIVATAFVLAALVVGWALAYPTLRLGRPGRVVAALLALAVLASPLLVPGEERLARLVLSVMALLLCSRGWDEHADAARGRLPSLREHWRFGVYPPFGLVRLSLDREPGPDARGNLARALRGALEALAGAVALHVVAGAELWRRSPALDFAAKVLAFYPLLDGSMVLLVAGWRFAGGSARDALRDPIISRTPAELWRRYNRVYGEWLRLHVYEPLEPRIGAGAAVLATFAWSGVVHEYIFWVPIGQVQGYQMAFFLVQGAAVVATARLRPEGWRAAVGVVATDAFMIATLAIFTASLAQVVPLAPGPIAY